MSANPSGFGRVLKQLREAAGLTQSNSRTRRWRGFGVAKLEQGLREPSAATVQRRQVLGTNCLAFAGDDVDGI